MYLPGLVAALYSRMNSPFDASALAVYFNGLAATAATEQVGLHFSSYGFDRKTPGSNETV